MPSRYEPLADNRRSIRLRGYDYTRQGVYAITACIAGRRRIPGTVRCGVMHLSELGALVEQAWHALPSHYPQLALDAFVVMPNYVHGAFKSFSARAINIDRDTPGARVWQRNYYERVIRDQRHLEQTRRYIIENPAKWGDDRFH